MVRGMALAVLAGTGLEKPPGMGSDGGVGQVPHGLVQLAGLGAHRLVWGRIYNHFFLRNRDKSTAGIRKNRPQRMG